jgi:hypothetical protein
MQVLVTTPSPLSPQVRRAIAEMEQERERRLYQTAVRQYEMAVGVAKPGAVSTPQRAR